MQQTDISAVSPLFSISGHAVTPLMALAAGAALVVVILLWAAVGAMRSRRSSDDMRLVLSEQSLAAEARLAEIMKLQSEMQGRMASMAEIFGTRQAELNKAINDRLDGMTQRLGTSISDQTKATHENLNRLQERLAVIDTAQNNIQSLAKDVVGLQAILSNKQTRGAFGQSRMETIVADGLPMGAYEFQSTLSNGSRPDCMIRMPNGQPSLVIDAKFPLEAWNAIRAAENPDAAKVAAQSFRRDMEVHIRDISEKYLLKGETQDTAFMFVPSESIFAEVHENFEGIIQRAHKARVVIVSPSLLMLSIQVIQSVLKDQRMREQAHLIQGEVINLMEDLTRLDDRVQKLQSHFTMTQKDVEQILTSTGKLMKRGARIEEMEFEAASAQVAAPAPDVAARQVESRTGLLKLRVVDED
jgi:DNA recombination protein RmuC